MKDVCEQQELLSKDFFNFSEKELKEKNINLRALSALLVVDIYYLFLHAKSTDTFFFCEIDINKSDGMDRIKKAISQILEKTYNGLNGISLKSAHQISF